MLTSVKRLGINSSLLKFIVERFSSSKMNINVNIYNILDAKSESLAADIINDDKVIAVPTDTVYGLACSAKSSQAVKSLYEIKGRDENKPVAICVSDVNELGKWGRADHLPNRLLDELLPGPVTVVLEQTLLLNNPYLNPHTTKIGIRIPDCRFIRNIAFHAKVPIALTSANPSSIPSSLSVDEFTSLYPKLGAVFDGGILGDGMKEKRVGSTVIDLSTKGFYTIVREGIACAETVELLKSYDIYPKSELF